MKKLRLRMLLSASIVLVVLLLAACKKGGDPAPLPPPGPPPPPPVQPEKKAIVTTVAGSTTGGFLDGTTTAAKFDTPLDVAVLTDGTLFVTDRYNHRIRKITVGGQVSTFAGNNNSGTENGNGIVARFKSPNRIIIDGNANMYTLDWDDTQVRKITPAADVTAYAGTFNGYADGPAATAKFNESWGLAMNAQGDIYIADTYNHRIRKISAAGQVTTVAGSGTPGFNNANGLAAQFNLPQGIVVDEQNNVYVAEWGTHRIRKITPAGDVSTFAGSGTKGLADGDATKAQFEDLFDMVRDANGNLYVRDNNRVRKVSPQGVVTTVAGDHTSGYADGEGTAARFHCNFGGLGIDKQGNLYVADDGNNCIRKIRFE